MNKVFISFLGTSDYVPCTYYHGDHEAADVRFVQEALLRTECRHWNSDDRALIFTTEEAYRRNWLNNGHIDHKTGKTLTRTGLKNCVSGLDPTIERIPIPDGRDASEIWIFSILCLKIYGKGRKWSLILPTLFALFPCSPSLFSTMLK